MSLFTRHILGVQSFCGEEMAARCDVNYAVHDTCITDTYSLELEFARADLYEVTESQIINGQKIGNRVLQLVTRKDLELDVEPDVIILSIAPANFCIELCIFDVDHVDLEIESEFNIKNILGKQRFNEPVLAIENEVVIDESELSYTTIKVPNCVLSVVTGQSS